MESDLDSIVLRGDQAAKTVIKDLDTIKEWNKHVEIESKHKGCLIITLNDCKILFSLCVYYSENTPETHLYVYRHNGKAKVSTEIGKMLGRIIDTAVAFNDETAIYLRFELKDDNWSATDIEWDAGVLGGTTELTYVHGDVHKNLLENLDMINMLGVSSWNNIEKIDNLWLSISTGKFVYLTSKQAVPINYKEYTVAD